MNDRNLGFTLIELLVALFIFSIISVISTTGLHTVFLSKEKLQFHEKALSDLQLATALLRQDFTQIIDRPVFLSGSAISALAGDETNIGFTRDGHINPGASQNRSNLQRVYYSTEQGKLLRRATTVLDNVNNPETKAKTLLDGFSKITFFYVDGKGNRQSKWDSKQAQGAAQEEAAKDEEEVTKEEENTFPEAIIVELDSSTNQKLTLVFKLTARSLTNDNQPQQSSDETSP